MNEKLITSLLRFPTSDTSCQTSAWNPQIEQPSGQGKAFVASPNQHSEEPK
jgi:hypothetical protein